MNYLKKVIYFLSGVIVLLGVIHLFLNLTSPEISIELTIKKIRFFIKNNFLLLSFIIIGFILVFYFIEKLTGKLKLFLKRINPIYRKVKKLNTQLEQGDLSEKLKDFKIIYPSTKLKFQYYEIAAKTHLLLSDFRNCNLALFEMKKLSKSSEELRRLCEIKFPLLAQAGDLNGAKSILTYLKENNKSKTDTILIFEALLLEKEGDLWKSRKKLQAVLSVIDKSDNQKIFPVYNNLGRVEGLFNNSTNKLLYYEKAMDIARVFKSKFFIHIIYPNIIFTYLLTKEYNKSTTYLKEYSSLIDYSSQYDLLNYYNYLLEHNRQINDKIELINTISLMHKNLAPNFSEEEQLNFDISELIFRFNNGVDCLELLFKIKDNFPLYDNFALSEKIIAFKEIFRVLESLKHTAVFQKFSNLYEVIFLYFRKAFYDIDDFIKNELFDFQIQERCSLISDKIYFLNFLEIKENEIFSIINQKLKLIEEIIDIYDASGNLILSFEYALNYIDECMHSSKDNISSKQVQILVAKINDKFEKIENKIELFSKYPNSPSFFIRLARYSLFLSNYPKAKHFINKFDETRMSINLFSDYIQKYYREVKSNV